MVSDVTRSPGVPVMDTAPAVRFGDARRPEHATHVQLASFDGPLGLLLSLIEGRQLDVLTVPRLEAVRFRITPPAYANRPVYEGPLPQGGLAGLPGTRVQVWVRSNRPLGGSVGEVSGAGSTAPLALEPVADNAMEAAGVFTL